MTDSEMVKCNLIWALTLAFLVGSVIWSTWSYHTTTTNTALQNGYVQDTVKGSGIRMWVKPNSNQ
jgi:hypothetical protein